MHTEPSGPTTRQVLLGLFIVGQLFFLVAANGIGLLDHVRPYLRQEPSDAERETFEGGVVHWSRLVADRIAPGWTQGEGHVNDALVVTSNVLSRWSQLTGQTQTWSLFAPGINHVTTFPAAELRWDEPLPAGLTVLAAANPVQAATLMAGLRSGKAKPPPTMLLSDNEPADLRSFFRVGSFRLRRYEETLGLQLSGADDGVDQRRVDGWRQRIEDKVRGEWPVIRAYLGWRLAAFRHRRPDLPPPAQVILFVRVYQIPAPDEPPPPGFWSRPDQRPLARWLPAAEEPGYLPIEMYNPVVERFERLKAP
jgi:hypothetical protein